jgi:hypothetical protein
MTDSGACIQISSTIANAKGCDARTLAVIAAQFIVQGDDEEGANAKA